MTEVGAEQARMAGIHGIDLDDGVRFYAHDRAHAPQTGEHGHLDKLIDDLAKGKKMEKILRGDGNRLLTSAG